MAATLKHVRIGRRRRFSKTSLFSNTTSGPRRRRRNLRPVEIGAGRVCEFSRILSAPTDGNEKAALVPESPNPPNLRQPSLYAPIIYGSGEQVLRCLTQDRTWVGAQIFDTILDKPALHLSQGVTMLLGMLILVSQPRVSPFRFTLSVA